MHQGSKFLDENALKYVSKKLDYFDNYNVELMFKFELDDKVEQLGYTSPFIFFHIDHTHNVK